MVNSIWKQYTEEKHWKCSHDQNPEHFLWGPSHIPGLWQLLKHWEIYLVWKYLILIHYQTTLEDHLHRCCKAAVNWRSPNAENKCSRCLKSTQGIVWSVHSTSKIVPPKKRNSSRPWKLNRVGRHHLSWPQHWDRRGAGSILHLKREAVAGATGGQVLGDKPPGKLPPPQPPSWAVSLLCSFWHCLLLPVPNILNVLGSGGCPRRCSTHCTSTWLTKGCLPL